MMKIGPWMIGMSLGLGCGPSEEQEAAESANSLTARTLKGCLEDAPDSNAATCKKSENILKLLEIDKTKECEAAGKVYDRNENTCSETVALGEYTCSFAGIESAFTATNRQITTQLQKSVGDPGNPEDFGDGYLIDQCGMTEAQGPVVFLVKLEEEVGARVFVRKLSEGEELTTKAVTKGDPDEESGGTEVAE